MTQSDINIITSWYKILGECDNQSFLDNEQLLQLAIECRTVRIGSYKYVPRENVVISHSGIRFGVPLLEDGKFKRFTEKDTYTLKNNPKLKSKTLRHFKIFKNFYFSYKFCYSGCEI